MKITPRDIAIKTAWAYLGKPYYWGGDDPIQGFDCSGFVIECLKSAGVLPRAGDWTAHNLYHIEMFPPRLDPHEGYLVFWHGENPNRIIHVELCLNDRFSIGASGGGSKTKTEADAIRQNAYIKIRPFRRRKNIAGFKDPF